MQVKNVYFAEDILFSFFLNTFANPAFEKICAFSS